MTNTHMSPSRAGDFAEYYAVTWLWDQGYQVFKNCGCTGPIDLIAIAEDDSIILIDVKTKRRDVKSPNDNLVYKGQLSDRQKELGVVMLAFNPDTRKCTFVEHRDETTYSRYRDEQQSQLDLDCGDAGC